MAITILSPQAGANKMANVLWGSLYLPGANYSYSALFATINVSGAKAASVMAGKTAGTNPAASQGYSFSMVGQSQNATKSFNIAATCAWSCQNVTGLYSIASVSGAVSLQGSSGTAVVGGNGSLSIRRNGSSGSGTFILAWSNGAGGVSLQTCAIPG